MKQIILLLLFFVFFSLASSEFKSVVIHTNSFQQDLQVLKDQPGKAFLLESVNFYSDVSMDFDEFLYLTELSRGKVVCMADIVQAVVYLHAKHCFDTITVEFFPLSSLNEESQGPQPLHLHITGIGFWRFAGLTIKGMFIGKDLYRQHYTINKGDIFDQGKHAACIEHINDICRAQGYFDAHITSYFHKNSSTKTVHTTLHIDRGIAYRVGAVRVHIDYPTAADSQEIATLSQQIYKNFLKPLGDTNYIKNHICQVAKSIKHWCEKQGFLQVSIELREHINVKNHAIDLQFSVELGGKKNFHFLGNSFFSHAQLMEQFLAFGTALSLLPIELIAEELTQWYKQKGFWRASIQGHEESEECFFTIDEGQQTVIDDVVLLGVCQFAPKKLQKKFFQKIIRTKTYDPMAISQAIDKLIAFYFDQGFWDCTCIDQNYELVHNTDNHYRLIITLEEGAGSCIEQITVEPFSELAKQGLLEQLVALKAPFTVQVMQEQRAYLEQRLKAMGYAHNPLRVSVTRHGTYVYLVWRVDAHEKVQPFGKTIIQGSTTIPFRYIVRELAYNQEHSFDRELLNVTRSRLQELRLFEQVHCYPTMIDGIEGQQPILLYLHQDDKFEVRLRAGLGLQQVSRQDKFGGLTYKAGGSFFLKNPFHYADYIRVDADVTRSYQRWHAWYIQPWLLQFPIQTALHGYAHRYQQPGLSSGQKSLYEFWQQGLLLEFHRAWPWYEGGLNIGLEWMKTRVVSHIHTDMFHKQIARALSFEPALLDRQVPYFFFEPTFFVNFLDNSLDPQRGSLTVLSCKAMIPVAVLSIQSYFIKILAEQSLFFPIYQTVCGLHFRFGHMFHRTFENIMPAERFYLGGAHSIRSYQTDMCPPLGSIIPGDPLCHQVPQGARTLLHASGEIRIPIYDRIVGAIFQDIGLLSNNMFADVAREKILAGTGFGIRIKTPIGPLRFDIAWKWYKHDACESSYAWFLTCGHAF